VKADLAKFMYGQFHGKAAAQVNLSGKVDHVHQAEVIASAIVRRRRGPEDHWVNVVDGELIYEDDEIYRGPPKRPGHPHPG
jgi:hypothetical protein